MDFLGPDPPKGIVTLLSWLENGAGWYVVIVVTFLCVCFGLWLLAPFIKGLAMLVEAINGNEGRNRRLQDSVSRRSTKSSVATNKEDVHSQKLQKPLSQSTEERRKR